MSEPKGDTYIKGDPRSTCHNGHPILPQEPSCPICGSSRMSDEGTRVGEVDMRCTNGHVLKADQRFCAECGQPAAGHATPLPPSPSPVTDKTSLDRKHVRAAIIGIIVAALIAVGVMVALSLHHWSEKVDQLQGRLLRSEADRPSNRSVPLQAILRLTPAILSHAAVVQRWAAQR